jgi:hypothetical protein
MRRALFIAILAVLTMDASGVLSLPVPETCAFEATESSPDSGCPAFCVRCSCACCVSLLEHTAAADVAATELVPLHLAPSPSTPVPTGALTDILHIPKTLLA